MPPVLEPPQVRRTTRYRQRMWRRRIALTLVRLAVLAAITGVTGGGYYLARRGFGREWRYRVIDELHKHGVDAYIGRLTLDPFRGLVARHVRIFDYKNRENTLALISEVSLDINYAALFHHESFLNAVDVRDAQITFPMKTAGGKAERVQLTNFPDALPSLQLKFSGDIAEMEKARVEATLRAERLQHGGYEMRDFSAAAEWNNQHLNIAHCEWSDATGNFTGRADWSRETDRANFQLRSSLNLKAFLDAFGLGEALAGIAFDAPPVVEISGSLNFGPERFRPDIIGHAAFGQFTYKKAPFSDLTADFSWDGERTYVRDLRVRHQTDQLRADVFDAPGDFRVNLESTISPDAVRGIVPPHLNEFLREWEWRRSPSVRLAIRGKDHNPENWQGDGTIILGRSRFRGTWMNSASTRIHFAEGALTCDDIHVARDEGIGSGTFTYDFRKHEVRLSNVRSSLIPAEVIFWIDPKVSKTVAPFKFHRPPNVTANGVYQFRGGKNTRVEITADGANGMDYVFLGKTLLFDRISARLLLTYDRLQILAVRGDIFSGTLRGNADLSLAKNNPRYHADLAVTNVDFPHLTNLYFNYYHYRTVRGQLTGTYDFDGFGTDSRKMRGSGKVGVKNGDVFAIPVLGPISEILNHIVPGIGYSIARDADTKFTIRDGIIHTDNFNVSGQLFSIVGHGDIHFLDDKINLDVRISANGPGIVLTPVYKLFEYKAEGSLKKPDWHPKMF